MNKPKYGIVSTSQFNKEVKLAKKRGYDISLLRHVVQMLANGETLPPKYKDHALLGKWIKHTDCRECHITPDWLLIYKISEENLFLYLVRTGTHSDLF